MNFSPSIVANVGLVLTIILALAGVNNRLRNDRTLLVVGVVALIIDITRFILRSESTGAELGAEL